MSSRNPHPKHVTLCTLCKREVSAVLNWARWQSGQSREWRIHRHRANEKKVNGRQVICPGSGILVDEAVVMEFGAVNA